MAYSFPTRILRAVLQNTAISPYPSPLPPHPLSPTAFSPSLSHLCEPLATPTSPDYFRAATSMDALSRTTPEAKLNSGCPLSAWHLDRYERDEMLLTPGGAVVPQRASDLLRNCDLPPPLKVFPATPKRNRDGGPTAGLPSPNQLFLRKPVPQGAVDAEELDQGGDAQDHLLKALRLSQTRAREAEKKAAALGEKNKQMASLLMEESLRLYAHRQWLKLLETENAWLQRQNGVWRKEGPGRGGVGPDPRGCVVVTMCLGIAGLGFVIGYRLLL